MQHTHTLKAPLSADAILNDYLVQQHNLTLKRSPASLQTAFKQVPPPHSPFVLNCASNQASLQTAKSKKAAYKQHSPTRHQNSLGNETPSDDSFDQSHHEHGATAMSGTARIERKLFTFFFVYIVIVATLFFTHAVYCYYQQNVSKRQQHQQLQDQVTQTTPAAEQALGSHALSSPVDLAADLAPETKQALEALQTKMDNKLHLLERYLEVLALDLEDTRNRLREREKCACSIGCSFNGTRYTDGQRWASAESKCDICSCQAGKISCAPRECPKLAANCESPVQLPGQCCPTCMKKCKLNKSLVSHGQTFRPSSPAKGDEPTKQCTCYNGLIKCEPILGASTTTTTSKQNDETTKQYQKLQPRQANAAVARNKTLEYLNSILAPRQQVLAQNERHRSAAALSH